MRSLKIKIVLISVLSTLGCERASNKLREITLACGVDYIGPPDYMKVESSDLRLLAKEEFEVFRYEGFDLTSVPVSSRGCIQAPNHTPLLIRSAKNDAAALLGTESNPSGGLVRLVDVKETLVDFKCRPDEVSRVQVNTKVSDFISSNAPSDIRQAFAIRFSAEGLDLSSHRLSLAEADRGDSFISALPQGKVQELTFTVENLLIKNLKFSKTCSILVDTSSPSVSLNLKSATASSNMPRHGVEDFIVVKEEDTLAFESLDEDIATIEYCASRLDDDFTVNDQAKDDEWRRALNDSTCHNYNKFDRTRPFTLDSKGFWTVNYRAVDLAGNVSLSQKKNFFAEATSQLKLIQVNAKNSIKSHLLEKDFESALKVIVGIEGDRLKLPTLYERDRAKSFVRGSILNTLSQKSISIPLDIKERMGDHLLFGPRSDKIIASIENKNIIFIDATDGLIQHSIALAENEVLRSFDVSLDERKVLLRYHSFLEFWENDGQTFKRRQVLDFPDYIQIAQFSAADRYIVAGGGTLRVYDTETFEIVREVSGSKSFRGSYPTAVSQFMPHIFYVAEEGRIERLDLSTGTITVLGQLKESLEVLQIVVDGEEKSILISDMDSGLWRFDMESKQLLAMDNPSKSNIDSLTISPAGDKFASFASAGSLLVRSMIDGHTLNTLEGLQAPHYSLSFSADGSKLVASGVNGKLRLWNLEDFLTSSIHSIDQSSLSEFFWKNDESLLLGHWPVATSDAEFYGHIDAKSKEFGLLRHEEVFDGQGYPTNGLAPFSSRWCFGLLQKSGRASSACHRLFDIFYNQLVVSEDLRIAVRIESNMSGISTLEYFDTTSFLSINSIEIPDLKSVVLSKDGAISYFFLSDRMEAVTTRNGKLIWSTPLTGQPFRFWLSANHDYLLVSLADYSLSRIDARSGELTNGFSWTSNQYASQLVGKVMTSADDKFMITQLNSGELSLWDVENQEIILKLDSLWRPDATQSFVTLNPSGSRIAIGTLKSGLTHKIRILDLDYDRLLGTVCELVSDKDIRRQCEAL